MSELLPLLSKAMGDSASLAEIAASPWFTDEWLASLALLTRITDFWKTDIHIRRQNGYWYVDLYESSHEIYSDGVTLQEALQNTWEALVREGRITPEEAF